MIPLTGSLVVIRGALLDGQPLAELAAPLAWLGGLSAALVGAAAVILRYGEARAQRTGALRLF